jgi:hypothetical protein
MKKAVYFLVIILTAAIFSCKKDFVETPSKKPLNEGLMIQNLALKKPDVPEEAVKEFFRAYVTAENVVLKLDPTNTAEDVGLVQSGEIVEILSKKGDRVKRQRDFNYWFKVKTAGGTTGWMNGSDLDFFSVDSGYSAESDLQLLHETTVESNFSPAGVGHEFLGMINYLTVDKNAGIKEVYLFDKYILIFIKGGYTFGVFDYNENLKFEDYPVFGNLLADVDTTFGPVGIWNDFLVVSSKIGENPKTFGYEANRMEIYNLKEGKLSCAGTYFDNILPDRSGAIKVYEELEYNSEEGKFIYREYSFDFLSDTLEPTGETKTYEYIDYQ